MKNVIFEEISRNYATIGPFQAMYNSQLTGHCIVLNNDEILRKILGYSRQNYAG
jgi:hypothetical protein